jgi:hypothetical protein
LACEHHPLVTRELARDLTDAPQVLAQQREPLHVGAGIGDLHSAAFASGERERGGDRSLDRAAPAQRATAVVDARQQSLLESVGDVGVTGEHPSTPDAGQQLQRRLAVAVFEILARETVTVGCEQQIAARACYEPDRFDGIERTEPRGLADSRGVRRDSLSALLSGGHASMSV